MSVKNKVLLMILDGWGLSPVEEGNAPFLAKTPSLDYVYKNYPKATISASGLEVGLHRGEMGNSEVGHFNIGTGRVVWESLPRIDYAIEKGEFDDSKKLNKIVTKSKGNKLHLIGLLSSGGVHSHLNHVYALLHTAKKAKVKEVYIHAILDGRDTQPNRAKIEISEVEKELKKIGIGKIVSVIGRYFAMDRDQRWDRTEKAYKLFVNGVGDEFSTSREAIAFNYKNKKTDEFIEPAVIDSSGTIENGDSVVFFNFRADRMRQIVQVFYDFDFHHFKRALIVPLNILTMMNYDKRFKLPSIFGALDVRDSLAKLVSQSGLKQFHIAETEKYPHVTYFFNGGVEEEHEGEGREMVPSPKVDTYDLKPEMSVKEVGEKVMLALNKNYDFILVNFANGDMVGHTGIVKAGILACEAVDRSVDSVLKKASEKKYKVIITADHGNCESMLDLMSQSPSTEHTTNPVPFVFLDFAKIPYNNNVSSGKESCTKEEYVSFSATSPIGVLSDVTTTVLSLLEIKKSQEMSGVNLISALGDNG